MVNGDSVLALSFVLFFIGLIGILKEQNIIKIFISFEIIIFASIVNFCYFSGIHPVRSGHFAVLFAVVFGCLVFSVIFLIISQNGEKIIAPSKQGKEIYDQTISEKSDD